MRFILFALLFIKCNSGRGRIVSINEIGWSFQMPSSIKFASSAFNEQGLIDKAKFDTSSYDQKPRLELFLIRLDKNNYFSTIIYVDTTRYAKWVQEVQDDSKFYIKLANETPELKVLDTLLTVESINNVSLQKEYIKIYHTISKDTFYSYRFSRRFNNYSIYMNIGYTDIYMGQRLMSIFKSSRFSD